MYGPWCQGKGGHKRLLACHPTAHRMERAKGVPCEPSKVLIIRLIASAQPVHGIRREWAEHERTRVFLWMTHLA